MIVEGMQGRAQIDEEGIVVAAGSPLVVTHTVRWPDMELNWVSRLCARQNAMIRIVFLGWVQFSSVQFSSVRSLWWAR